MAPRVSPVEVHPIRAGDGRSFPRAGDTVTVHYVGTPRNAGKAGGEAVGEGGGEPFDSSYAKGVPFSFTLGCGEVIKGWELGIPQLSLGAKARLHIHASAAYGTKGCRSAEASGSGVIAPNADLAFEIELLDINGRCGVVALHKYKETLHKWAEDKLHRLDTFFFLLDTRTHWPHTLLLPLLPPPPPQGAPTRLSLSFSPISAYASLLHTRPIYFVFLCLVTGSTRSPRRARSSAGSMAAGRAMKRISPR